MLSPNSTTSIPGDNEGDPPIVSRGVLCMAPRDRVAGATHCLYESLSDTAAYAVGQTVQVHPDGGSPGQFEVIQVDDVPGGLPHRVVWMKPASA